MAQSQPLTQNPRKKRRFIWILLALLLILLYLLVTNENGLLRIRRLGNRVKALKAEVETLKGRKRALQAERDLLKNDLDYIEKIAREEYGMLKKGEKIYKVKFIRGKKEVKDN